MEKKAGDVLYMHHFSSAATQLHDCNQISQTDLNKSDKIKLTPSVDSYTLLLVYYYY